MKSLMQIASLWDRKPIAEEDDCLDALEFIKNADPRAGKASEGIGHCLRAMKMDDTYLDHCLGLTLGYLNRHGLGRPALRLMTAVATAELTNPGTPLAFAAGHCVASLLDNPTLVNIIKPHQRLEGEAVIVHTLGTETKRGQRAIAAAVMAIQSDRNDEPAISLRNKRDHLEYISGAASAAGMSGMTARTRQIEAVLELRTRISRRQQSGAGIFYPVDSSNAWRPC